MKKKALCFVLLFIIVSSMTAEAAVAGPKVLAPYRDVTLRRVDAKSYTAIVFVKKYGGWRGLTIKGKLYPNRLMKKGEFIRLLVNLYGDEVQLTPNDRTSPRANISGDYVCRRFAELSPDLGFEIEWHGDPKKLMRRKDVARYAYIFAKFNPALMPGPY